MTGRNEMADPAGLDELAAVTKAYGRYSGAGFGLGATGAGAWVLAAEWVLGASRRAGQLLFSLAPLVFIGLATASRAYYQRHGRVVGTPGEASSFEVRAMATVSLFVVALVGIDQQYTGPRDGLEILAAGAMLATAMIAVRVGATRPDILGGAVALLVFAAAAGHGPGGAHDGWARVTVGVLFVVSGVVGHLQYRRLERRLAALKRSAS